MTCFLFLTHFDSGRRFGVSKIKGVGSHVVRYLWNLEDAYRGRFFPSCFLIYLLIDFFFALLLLFFYDYLVEEEELVDLIFLDNNVCSVYRSLFTLTLWCHW